MAEITPHNLPGLVPRVGVIPGASMLELVSAARGLVAGLLEAMPRDDMTQQEWAAMAMLGLAHAFLVDAEEKAHG